MSEEIGKKEYLTRKADYNLQKSRLQTQLEIKYRGDDGYNITVLNTLKILSKAKDIFTATTRSLTDKQLLLHLLFKQIVLQEGIISCILNQPFSFILSYDVLKATGNDTATKTESCELQESQGLQADLGGVSDALKKRGFEPQILFKNQEVTSENATSVLSGWRDDCETEGKSGQIYYILVSHCEEILAMKEQVQLIRGFLAA